MIGGFAPEQHKQVRYTAAYHRKIECAKRRIFDSLEREGINLFGIKHKNRVNMFCEMHGFIKPPKMRWQDYIIELYECNWLPDPTPKKREPKKPSIYQQQLNEESERKKRYRDYINSPEWKAFRLKALDHFGNRCGLCDREGKMDLHHKTYKNFMNETFADVIPLCKRCHNKHHSKT